MNLVLHVAYEFASLIRTNSRDEPKRRACSGKQIGRRKRRRDAFEEERVKQRELEHRRADAAPDVRHELRIDLPDGCVDAFVTDPPYSSGGAFRGDRVKDTTAKYVSTGSANREIPAFEGDVRDQRSFTLWTALWSSEASDTVAAKC